MKQRKKSLVMMVATLLMATSVWAGGTVTVIKQLNGTVNDAAGTVEASEPVNNKVTLTVTPAEGNYITVEFISAERTIDGGSAQGRLKAPAISNAIAVENLGENTDPSGTTTYQFTMPDAAYDVEVVANFQSRISIAEAVVTLAETGYDYDGQAKEPAVSSVVLGTTTLIQSTDYTFEWSDNVNAGTGTVTVTGQGIYTGTATATFTINKAALSNLTVTLAGWTYNEYDEELNVPTVSGNLGQGDEEFYYKVKDADDNTYTAIMPGDAGNYTVKVEVAESDNYQAGSATADFTIAKADLELDVMIDGEGWTYGEEAKAPQIDGNLGGGEETITYANATAPAQEFTAIVPTNAGNYIVKVEVAETANYNAAQAQGVFTIQKANFSGVEIAAIADQTFTGNAITPELTVTFNDNPVDASEYEVRYEGDRINVGIVTITLNTNNINFSEGQTNPTITFNIVPAQAVVTAEDQTKTYNGMEQEFTKYEAEVEVIAHYFASEADREAGENELEVVVDAETYYVKLESGDENYTFAPVFATFTIAPKSLEDVELWSEIGENGIAYTGVPIVFEDGMFGLTDEIDDEGIDLVKDEDFTVAYANNTNVGKATVTLTGTGNYTDEVSFTFDIVRNLNITFGDNREWATYYAEENLQLPAGLKAYIVTGIDQQEVTVTKIDYIPQHVGVLLNYEGNIEELPGDFEFLAKAYTGDTQTFETNLLAGCATATAVSSLPAENDIYVLYNDEFVKTTSGNIPAFRCYLPVAKNDGAHSRLTIVGHEVSGISNISREQHAEEAVYDLNGRRMASSLSALHSSLKKGLYIQGGKKVVVK